MDFLSGEEIIDLAENITYKDTQISEKSMDLTVKNIYKLENRGEIDFGGGERKDGKTKKVETSKKNPDDDYGWWNLEPGTYLVEYNEELKEERPILLQPLERLTKNSAIHPTKIVGKLEKIPLVVGETGINIKENSRISRILVPE